MGSIQILKWPRGLRRQKKIFVFVTIFILSILVMAIKEPRADEIKNQEAKNIEIEYGYPDQSIFVATINDKGQPDSPMTLVADELLTRAGLSWHATAYPARRLFNNLKNGTTNFSILVRASSLIDSCIFSKKPIYSTSLNVYYHRGKPPITSKEDLVGTHIITIRGYSYGGLLKFISDPANEIVNEVASTHKSAFKMLEKHRADYLVDYASAAGDILSESPIQGLTSVELKQLDIFLVLSKTHPDAKNLMVRLEQIAETLNIDEILRKKVSQK